jgi:hypothetical protein
MLIMGYLKGIEEHGEMYNFIFVPKQEPIIFNSLLCLSVSWWRTSSLMRCALFHSVLCNEHYLILLKIIQDITSMAI